MNKFFQTTFFKLIKIRMLLGLFAGIVIAISGGRMWGGPMALIVGVVALEGLVAVFILTPIFYKYEVFFYGEEPLTRIGYLISLILLLIISYLIMRVFYFFNGKKQKNKYLIKDDIFIKIIKSSINYIFFIFFVLSLIMGLIFKMDFF